jgi:DNA-binding IclR family transcriptional regulator
MIRSFSRGLEILTLLNRRDSASAGEVTKKLNWPVALATISGVDVVELENTDQISPLAIENFSSGYRMPILHTASGICILSHMKTARRKIILGTLEEMNRKQD